MVPDPSGYYVPYRNYQFVLEMLINQLEFAIDFFELAEKLKSEKSTS